MDEHGTLGFPGPACDDKVVGRVTGYGTQQGSFAGIEPTGKKIAFAAIHIVRFENGKAVEWWGMADLPGAIQ